jgi:propionyl-CoA carboxylase alpha chain
MRTAKRLGIKTVAVYSDVDARASHVQMADEAYCVGPAPSSESYLVMEKILDVAKKTGAQGIHPGYGFLSENAKFVDMVEEAGIAFIGPSSGPMDSMGDKINSKKIAKDAGCFVIPGYEGEIADEDMAVKMAEEVGYPVMIKASAGGGGKGMRVAYNAEEVRDGFRLSKAEALSSFGDDRMLIERFIEDPHHIEIQVVADMFGNVAAFPERECSVQRRNQKVVEESPSCLLLPETRRAMQEQAIQLCHATGYRSAGTVEMLADGKQNFYFLEMNTRLQVEHPVTEMVTGEDLVEHMLWVAAGEKLPNRLIEQPFVPSRGWAIESRIYAEDPLRNFLPSTGPLISYSEPKCNSYGGLPPQSINDTNSNETLVRCDSGVYEGATISMFYDPMISKLITQGGTRDSALKAMEKALDSYVIDGLGNNLTFLRSVMRNDKFRKGDYGTKFIEEEYPDGFHGVTLSKDEEEHAVAMAATLHWMHDNQSTYNNSNISSSNPYVITVPELVTNTTDSTITTENVYYAVKVSETSSDQIKVDLLNLMGLENNTMPDFWQGHTAASKTLLLSNIQRQKKTTVLQANINNDLCTFQQEGRHGCTISLRYQGAQLPITVRNPREHALSGHMLAPEVKDLSKFLLCPMPGKLVSCNVQEGDWVEEGQELAIVEAMKMQNILRAEKAARVSKLLSSPGEHLKVDQVILEFEQNEKDGDNTIDAVA